MREGWPMTQLRAFARVSMAVVYVVLGFNHFRDPDFYVAIMPPYLPYHLFLVYLSGVFEIVLGLLVLPERTRKLGGYGLIALLIAVFPANLHMAMSEVLIDGEPAAPRWALYLRLPIQLVLIAWAFWVAREPPKANDG